MSRSFAESKFVAKRQEYPIKVANEFFAEVTHEVQNYAIEALEGGDLKATLRLFKQVSNNFGATRDMQGERMLFVAINSDPGAKAKQKSFANDVLRNEFSPGVAERGRSSSAKKKFQLYEEQCLRATIRASANAQANHHLSAVSYGTTSGARAIPRSKKHADQKQEWDGKQGTGAAKIRPQAGRLIPQWKGKGVSKAEEGNTLRDRQRVRE